MALHRIHNEAEILGGVAKGDEKAFAELFYAYYNQLGEFIFSLTHDTDAAAEIVQEVFAKVWINRESFPLIKSFDAYLFILCRNHTLNYLRRLAAERKKYAAYLREADTVEEATEITVRQDAHELVERAVQLLPPQQKEVFILRQKGLKNPEISRQMNLSVESVKKYQHLAMKFVSEFVRAKVAVSIALSLLLLK
ncbi:sigma-70 family RNA polymerase sigma factor [Parapedobacter deserti]|uniref:Sigma-70 family RNA polymerase sigma factor n=1 Tax=Parapedobacter deserti TaxID=1912957 RepID=A0ABV7JLM6_9SPHI